MEGIDQCAKLVDYITTYIWDRKSIQNSLFGKLYAMEKAKRLNDITELSRQFILDGKNSIGRSMISSILKMNELWVKLTYNNQRKKYKVYCHISLSLTPVLTLIPAFFLLRTSIFILNMNL
jgi:hypothetical protein